MLSAGLRSFSKRACLRDVVGRSNGAFPCATTKRFASSSNRGSAQDDSNMKVAYYAAALAMTVFGASYASVPLYKVFCQVTGFGGTTQVADEKKAKSIKPVEGGDILKVYFMANVHSETALAFYTVKNTADHPVMGVATYNVHPPKAGLYFNKIQCFCFEEQRVAAHEEIDMPVFFFIDPEIVDDPAMEGVRNITLSYTFFKTGEETAETVTGKEGVVAKSSR